MEEYVMEIETRQQMEPGARALAYALRMETYAKEKEIKEDDQDAVS